MKYIHVGAMYKEGYVELPTGLNTFYRSWLPEDKARGLVIGVHGFAEHSGRYLHVGEALSRYNYAFYIHDLRGHGKSRGEEPGYIDSFNEFIDDLDSFMDYAIRDSGIQGTILLGHSMGGLIVLHYLAKRRRRVKAAVVTGAATLIIYPVLQRILLELMSMLSPRKRIDLPIDPGLLSSDPSVGEKYAMDELVLKKPTLKLIYELYRASKEIWRIVEEIDTPVLIIHGENDRIVNPEGSRRLYDRLRVSDKELKIYPGMRHEVLNEPEWLKVLEDIIEWINKHVQ
ncbi:alpha/beta hydrolase fold protein [Desulfurococcus amylolyticus 1221n]|uniref:Alpha/beta hydrolase fold protein n=3 Tax=Desulfurococcus TaxID=2273 RepID=B8D528_DESA1|nr:alpha/beta hydrolase fold protein [Desulfurococcus amylolyticus 1221n]